MKKIILLIISFSIWCNISQAAPIAIISNAEPIIIKLSHTDRANSLKGKSAIRFKEMLEAKFNKRIKVEIYENSSLYKDSEELEAVQLGVVNIIIPSADKIAELENIRELQIFDLPFLFSSNDEFKKVINSATSEEILRIVNKKLTTTQSLGYWSSGFRNFVGNQVYKAPSDLKNKVASLSSSGINNLFYNDLNIKKIIKVIPSENKNLFIPTNKISDVTELSLNEYIDLGMSDTLKNITLSQHNYATNLVMVNKNWFKSLPEDIKAGIIEGIKNTSQYNLDLIVKSENDIKSNIVKTGVNLYTWTEKEKELFKKAAIPIHTKFLNEVNKELLINTYQEINKK